MDKRRFKIFRWSCFLTALAIMLGIFYWQEIRNAFVDDTQYQQEIARAAGKYRLDPRLVRAVIFRESRFDRYCVGKAGEVGLMQVLPKGAVADWARKMKMPAPSKRELFRPTVNLEIGCFYLAAAMKRWEGYKEQIPLALCQYNAGESRARRWSPKDKTGDMRKNITIKSTRSYVDSIMKRYNYYCEEKLQNTISGCK